jgi:hypothetical protein
MGAWKRVLIDKARQRRYIERMRAVKLRLLLLIILVVVGATVFVGMNLEDSSELGVLQTQVSPSLLSQQKKVFESKQPASDVGSSRPNSEAFSRMPRLSLDLVPILRC